MTVFCHPFALKIIFETVEILHAALEELVVLGEVVTVHHQCQYKQLYCSHSIEKTKRR
jgi:hypothetical protein